MSDKNNCLINYKQFSPKELLKFIYIIDETIINYIGNTEYEKLRKGEINEEEYPLIDEKNKLYLINIEEYQERIYVIIYNFSIDKFFSYYTSQSGGYIFHLHIPLFSKQQHLVIKHLFKPLNDYVTGLTIDIHISANIFKNFDKKYYKFKTIQSSEEIIRDKLLYLTHRYYIPEKFYLLLQEYLTDYFGNRLIDFNLIFSKTYMPNTFLRFDSIMCDDDEISEEPSFIDRYNEIRKEYSKYFQEEILKKKINQLKSRCIYEKKSKIIEENYKIFNIVKLCDMKKLENFFIGQKIRINSYYRFDLQWKHYDEHTNIKHHNISMFIVYYIGPSRDQYLNITSGEKNYSICVYITPFNVDVNEFGLTSNYFYTQTFVWKILEYKQQLETITPSRTDSRDYNDLYNFIGDLQTDLFPAKYYSESYLNNLEPFLKDGKFKNLKEVDDYVIDNSHLFSFAPKQFTRVGARNESTTFRESLGSLFESETTIANPYLSSSNVNGSKKKYLKYKAKYLKLKKEFDF